MNIVIKNHEMIENDTNLSFNNNTLVIPSKTVFSKPLKITLLEDNHEEIVIKTGSNSDLKIILEVNDNNIDMSDYKIKLDLGENTSLKYLLISALNSSNAILSHEFYLNKDANLDLLAGLVSNVLTAKIDVKVAGIGSSCKIRAVAVSSLDNDQKIDVYMNHMAPNTFGDMTNIGIASKNGRVVLNGVEKIEQGMKNANVYQTLKGVITSDTAIVEVNPILLIDEYDIKAGHAATVGRIEEESLYYLQSRGLTKKEAEKLVITGFLRPVIDEIEDEELKQRFSQLVDKRI